MPRGEVYISNSELVLGVAELAKIKFPDDKEKQHEYLKNTDISVTPYEDLPPEEKRAFERLMKVIKAQPD